MKIYNHCYCYISKLYLFRFCLFIILSKIILFLQFCFDMNTSTMLNNLYYFIIFILIILRMCFFFTSIYLFEKYELINVYIVHTFINNVFFALIFE